MLFGLKSPPRFRVLATVGAIIVIFLGRRDTNTLMAAATPIFTNILPPGYEVADEKKQS